MKTSILTFLVVLPCAAMAQTTTDTSTTPSTPSDSPDTSGSSHKWGHHHGFFSPDQELKFLTTKLTLSDTQQGEIKPILVSKDDQLKALHDNTSLTEDQKHQQMKTIFETTHEQIKGYLNPAQVPLFESMHHHSDHSSPPQQ